MTLFEKLTFISKLLDDVIEEVLANIGSPPFPDLDKLEKIRENLHTYASVCPDIRKF